MRYLLFVFGAAVGATGIFYLVVSLKHRASLLRGEFVLGLFHGCSLLSVGIIALAAASAPSDLAHTLVWALALVILIETALRQLLVRRLRASPNGGRAPPK